MKSPIAPFRTMALMSEIEARRRVGLPVYRFDLGEPSMLPSEAVRRRAADAILAEPMGYTEIRGRHELRARIARWYREEEGVEVDPERIIVTNGSSAGLTLALMAAFEPGDAVILPRPGYPAYRNMLAALHLKPIEVACGPAEHFHLTGDLLEQVKEPAKGVLFSSPANPTGAMLDEAQIRALIAAADARGLRVISDEIYHGLAFDKPCFSAARFEPVMVINSFSKFWRMTGWRIGWMVAPSDLAPLIERLAQNLFLSPSAPAQVAALQALEEADDARAPVEAYRANRDAVLASLRRLGVRGFAPAEGAFYVYADVSSITDDSEAFVKRLLRETGVALAPGIDFDPIDGHRWVRFSIAGPGEMVRAGLERLEAWVAETASMAKATV